MTRRTIAKILAVVAIVGGVGCLIGGVWVPPLFGVGAALLAGALGLWQGVFVRPETPRHHEQEHTAQETAHPNTPESQRSGHRAYFDTDAPQGMLTWHIHRREEHRHITRQGSEQVDIVDNHADGSYPVNTPSDKLTLS